MRPVLVTTHEKKEATVFMTPVLATALALSSVSGSAEVRVGVGLRQPVAAQQPQPDPTTVPPDARRAARKFWAALPSDERAALERALEHLEARAQAGESIDEDLTALRARYPELVRIAAMLTPLRWITADSPGTTYVCTGMTWIGRNGRVRCIGSLATGT